MTTENTPHSFFAVRRFEGSISGENFSMPIGFSAEVDGRGNLNIILDTLPTSRETFELQRGLSRGQETPLWKLHGVGPKGEILSSDDFTITGYRSSDDASGSKTTLKGQCYEAEIVSTLSEPCTPQFRWGFRRFRSFTGMRQQIEEGMLFAGGAPPDPNDSQILTGSIVVKSDQSEVPTSWWSAIEDRADHVRRVLSLASGVYLQPYIEDRLEGTEHRLRIFRRGKTPQPFLSPFHFLNLEPIFKSACQSPPDVRARFLELDSALRWLLAPGHYDESRLLGAMTALENIVEQTYPSNKNPLMKRSVFEKFAKAVRALMREMALPDAALAKVPELNRANFIDKVMRYVSEHGIVVADFPNGGLDPVIKARNVVVHTGIYFNDTPGQIDLWDHILVARELVIRILLDALKFEGNYFSALHGDEQLRFPSCRRLADDQNIEIPVDDPRGEPRPPSKPSSRQSQKQESEVAAETDGEQV